MHLKELADQTDPHAFQLLYHDPCVHTSEIAEHFGIQLSRLSEFAHLLGIPTRREAGVIWEGVRGRRSGDSKNTDPQSLAPDPYPGKHGCNADCPEWRRCRAGRLWVDGPLPCEVMLRWETENEFERDSLPTLWSIPLVVTVNIEAMA